MISIIIIVKNDRRIKKTLSKLVKIEKPEKTEIIVIDASKGKLDDIKEKFPSVNWFYFYNKTNKEITIPEQRNIGINKSKGDLIIFIDADCMPTRNWLKEIIKPIREEHEYIVSGLVEQENTFISKWESNKYERLNDKKYINDAPTMNFAFLKSIVNKVGLFDEKFNFSSDTDFCWRARDLGYKIRYAQKAIIYHNYGNMFKNIKRHFNYGKAKIDLCSKYPHKLSEYSFIIQITYVLFILLLPLTIIFPYYLLFLFIPLSRYFVSTKKISTATAHVFFNFVEASGSIIRCYEKVQHKK